MGRRIAFGEVRPLVHAGCSVDCRDLCFEERDPEGRLVRMTHGVWLRTLSKLNRAHMAAYYHAVEGAITTPQTIHGDPINDVTLLYYGVPPDAGGKRICVAVKCLPRRFRSGSRQRRYRALGALLRTNAGEAWVCSAYFVPYPKPRGFELWPS
jgi:hypothetical protein